LQPKKETQFDEDGTEDPVTPSARVKVLSIDQGTTKKKIHGVTRREAIKKQNFYAS
jgi:hypothetical protein